MEKERKKENKQGTATIAHSDGEFCPRGDVARFNEKFRVCNEYLLDFHNIWDDWLQEKFYKHVREFTRYLLRG